MFITKKHIPRRTFLRGAGVALALAVARFDDSRRRRRWQRRRPIPRPASPASLFRTAWRPDGGCRKGAVRANRSPRPEARLRVSDDHEAARAVPRSGHDHERAVVQIGRAASGRDRRRSLGGGRIPVRRTSRRRPPARTSTTAPPSIRSSRRRSGRRRCCLRSSWASRTRAPIRATAAKAIAAPTPTPFPGRRRRSRSDGAQSAGGVRAPVRRWRHSRGARRAPGAGPQHSRFGDAEPGPVQAGSRSGRPARDSTNIATDIREIERRLEIAKKASAEVRTDGVVVPTGVPESFDEHVKLQFDLQRWLSRPTSRACPRFSMPAI